MSIHSLHVKRDFSLFCNKRITVMGLGLHGGGEGTARFLAKAGANVTVTDLKTRAELAPSINKLKGMPIRYVLGRHVVKDFTNADMVVYNPGIRAKFMRLEDSPYLAAALKKGVPLETDIGIFFDLANRGQIVGVTGSKGKSTTAALIAHLLKQKYPDTLLAGNIRTSVFDVLPRITSKTPIVLELSNWQLEGLAKKNISPHIAVITNILHEHLNTYRNFHGYIEAKKHILRFQKPDDIAVLNKSLAQWEEFKEPCGKARRVWFAKREPLDHKDELKLPGAHNRENLVAALAVARLYRIPAFRIRKALATFEGLEGRLQTVRTDRGITCINDTTATMPDAVIAALRSMPRPQNTILIVGGVDKKFDFNPMARFIAAYPPKALVMLPGSATEKLINALRKAHCPSPIIEASSMRQAVYSAWKAAQKGDTILLSPGAASFNLFKNEFDRGEQFVKAVNKIR
ncbi:MAG: UDP-N-acetylmuramoyl-L-alanine--D-glutamate ligase [bacterium]|nr:UDP-N-acetylmuramoyl-L-alanine--D-glutamate ligase [bacterium]